MITNVEYVHKNVVPMSEKDKDLITQTVLTYLDNYTEAQWQSYCLSGSPEKESVQVEIYFDNKERCGKVREIYEFFKNLDTSSDWGNLDYVRFLIDLTQEQFNKYQKFAG